MKQIGMIGMEHATCAPYNSVSVRTYWLPVLCLLHFAFVQAALLDCVSLAQIILINAISGRAHVWMIVLTKICGPEEPGRVKPAG